MIRILTLFILGFLIIISSCSDNVKNKNKTVSLAAAANLRYVLEDINQSFEKKTGIKIEMSTASSGKLTAQIQNGAPYEIFLSANKKYPDYLYKNGFGINKPEKICSGILVLWTNKNIALTENFKELCALNLETIAIANPQNAPFGRAAVETLKVLNIYKCFEQKIIYTENVSQISQYIINKNADLAFTSKSIVLSDELVNTGKWIEVPDSLHNPLSEYAILTKKAKNKENAKKYYRFLFSKEAQNIFLDNGYRIRE